MKIGCFAYSHLCLFSKVGPSRSLLLINPQFRRAEDFGRRRQGEAEEAVFGRFRQGWAFEELSVRGEAVKLTYDFPGGWLAFAALDEAPMARTSGGEPLPLLEAPTPDRPVYGFLEQRLNALVPQVAWKRGLKPPDL